MIALAIAALLQTTVPPEQARAYARVDEVGSYLMATTVCSEIGWTLSDGATEQIATRVYAEQAEAGVDQATVDLWSGEILRRHSDILRTEMTRAAASFRDQGELTALADFFAGADRRCDAFASDPISVGLISSDGSAARALARQAKIDSWVEVGGLASWQTPALTAKGDLLMALGACSTVLPTARRDAMLTRHLPPAESRDRASVYLTGQYLEGIRSAAEFAFNEVQCERLVGRRTAAVP